MCNGRYIKEIRDDYGFTQKEFSIYFGIKLRTVQNWESRGCSDNIYKLLNRCRWSDSSRVIPFDKQKFKDFMRKELDDYFELFPW